MYWKTKKDWFCFWRGSLLYARTNERTHARQATATTTSPTSRRCSVGARLLWTQPTWVVLFKFSRHKTIRDSRWRQISMSTFWASWTTLTCRSSCPWTTMPQWRPPSVTSRRRRRRRWATLCRRTFPTRDHHQHGRLFATALECHLTGRPGADLVQNILLKCLNLLFLSQSGVIILITSNHITLFLL